MSADPVAVAQPLYDAIDAHDAPGILAALQPDFVGTVSTGMPCGVGGRHEGADAMLRNCWGPIFAAFDVALEIDVRLVAGPERAVFCGRYVGTERATRRPVDAAFAHVLRVRDGRVSELRQITDTARWGFDPAPG